MKNGAAFALGVTGQAFSLTGMSQFVSVPGATTLHVPGGDFALLSWVKLNALVGDMSIVDKMGLPSGGNPNTDGWRLIKQGDNHFWFCFGASPGNGCGNGASTTVRSTTVTTTGVWYCVAGTKTSTTFSIYVKGN